MSKCFIVFAIVFVSFIQYANSQQRQLLLDNFSVGNSVFRINAAQVNGEYKFWLQREDTNYLLQNKEINNIETILNSNSSLWQKVIDDENENRIKLENIERDSININQFQDSISTLKSKIFFDSIKIKSLNNSFDSLNHVKANLETTIQNSLVKTFKLYSVDENIFKYKFTQTIDSILSETGMTGSKEIVQNDIQNSADQLYLKIYNNISLTANELVAGVLTIKCTVPVYIDTGICLSNGGYFHITHIGISVENGVIPDIRVVGYMENNEQTTACFTQPFGCIPFSKIADPITNKKNYVDQSNYTYNYPLYLLGFGTNGIEYRIFPDQFLFYFPEVNAHAHNISPGDSVYSFNLHGYDYSGPLYREATSKILSFRIYSDPVGFNDDQPNGLVQFEVSKKMIESYESYRHPYTFFHFIEPQLTWSKIEENNKSLVLSSIEDTFFSPYKPFVGKLIDPMDLYRYSNLSLGFNQNIFFTKFGKTNSQFSIGIENIFMRTRLRDSVLVTVDTNYVLDDSTHVTYQNTSLRFNDFSITSLYFGPSFEFVIKPDDRYGLTLGWKTGLINILNDQVHVNNDYLNNHLININAFSFGGYFKLSPGNEFYFRTTYNFMGKLLNKNFMQMQVGVSESLFKHKD